ncbi:UDP-N-acetylmuramoyl-L-alanyl-D-glutamate--2,6-diaminopimelate ligase [Planococcus lenghuensis]|uniref:UDP-N-acetylmuramoyl-L-alanyl-D-glutamate--2, 6-diaminopimelate ligase n=2 Tax=Planococcus lenghuensis TaxID=2213202 RepID=A0A1Q2KV74_9BACL|nr:UDP-N-acetylmuramoyl-L-alanyl-D-glutamate--2,6-diaminopimelate ligase [Planococcus lenghuensis]
MNLSFDKDFPIRSLSFHGPIQQEISSVIYNSENVTDGAVFVCIPGENTDGHFYIEEAVAKGAAVIIGSDAVVLDSYKNRFENVTFALVEDPREALALFSIALSEVVQDRLVKVGITGTNGKTTVAAYVRNLFNLVGMPCGLVGTNGVYTSKSKLAFKKTTPIKPLSADLHRIFSILTEHGDEAVSMEVTSIALDQKRTYGVEFEVAVHTNLSEEHLEYHKTIACYRQAKLKLFSQTKKAVVNLDDRGMAREILETADCPILTYSQKPGRGAHLTWTNVRHTAEGMRFDLIWQGDTHSVTMPLFADYNVGNMAAAIGALLQADIPMERVLPILPEVERVEGRFQLINGPEERRIIIDYAHTPVALNKVLKASNELKHNRLIALIAGIGIRDFGKMPKMARAAEGKADVLVVTVDHPGDHEPEVVINEVMKGFSIPHKQQVMTAMTRKAAVEAALQESGPGDIILLTSGCINGAQIIKGEYVPHSDEEIIDQFFLAQR